LSKDLDEITLQKAKTALDEEIIRMIKTMPRWKPGMQKGRLVKVSLSLPIVFEL
jgi:protein TonB